MTSHANRLEMAGHGGIAARSVSIFAGDVHLDGELNLPPGAAGIVLFAHGSGSSRHSPRNQFVAGELRKAGLGTLLFDLLTAEEEVWDSATAALRFDIGLLARRLVAATHWLREQPATRDLAIGYFGASTGGAAALVAAAQLGTLIGAVVSRGGRPDLAGDVLSRVQSPTLLIVGGCDDTVVGLNAGALELLACEKQMHVIPRATHLFEEPGALDEVARLAAEWFQAHLLAGAHGNVITAGSA